MFLKLDKQNVLVERCLSRWPNAKACLTSKSIVIIATIVITARALL